LQFSTYEVEDTNDAPHPAANVNPKWRAEIHEGLSVERPKETLDLDSDDKTDSMESEQFEEVTRGMNFILAPDIFQEIMDRLNEIGPTPLIKKRKQSDQTLPFFRVSLIILT
jgi:hypothetical protein